MRNAISKKGSKINKDVSITFVRKCYAIIVLELLLQKVNRYRMISFSVSHAVPIHENLLFGGVVIYSSAPATLAIHTERTFVK